MTRATFPDEPLRERWMVTRRHGKCPACGGDLEEGEDVADSGERVTERYCPSCWWSDGDE